MALSIISSLSCQWPFSLFTKQDDLTISNKLVQNLSIPDQTKQFVFAFREPDTQAVVYILAIVNLSEQSAIDSVHLIKEVKPKTVIAQISPLAVPDIEAEEKCLNEGELNTVPTSPFGVLKKCFTDQISKSQYEKIAGFQVLQEIFGIGFFGPFLAAKKAAEEVKSDFLILESPYDDIAGTGTGTDEDSVPGQDTSFQLQANYMVPGGVISTLNHNFRNFCLNELVQTEAVKSLVPALNASLGLNFSSSEPKPGEYKLEQDYVAPPFAQAVYSLLSDLRTIFSEIPSMENALISSQHILSSIHEGKPINSQILSDVYTFRPAIEGLRVALNAAARIPMDKLDASSYAKLEFEKLPYDEKCHVLFAQALKTQAKKFGSLVAIVDAGCLCGIRRHWTTPVPPELENLQEYEAGDKSENLTTNPEKKHLLSDKPMVAVGAGATAILGVSSLSKISSYKIPWALKFAFSQFQRKTAIGLGKVLTSSKLKFYSAEKIRAVTHTMIASAERTSFLAMRTAFYEIMQKRGVRSVGRAMPWVTFGCSMGACGGLLVFGEGIECVAENAPAVPSIVSLGKGMENLRNASEEVRVVSGVRVQEAFNNFMTGFRKIMRG